MPNSCVNTSCMKILEPHSDTGWITAIVDGRWVQAKVYDEGSCFGINGGRVSKLSIGKSETRDPNANFFDQMAYHYDRGLDFHHKRQLSKKVLDSIVSKLEALPVSPLR